LEGPLLSGRPSTNIAQGTRDDEDDDDGGGGGGGDGDDGDGDDSFARSSQSVLLLN